MESSFPRLRITSRDLVPMGSFAEAQAAFLRPDRSTVDALSALCREKKIGIVAHFYMDAELQGVITASDWPHVFVADSLQMADSAVKMAEAGCTTIVVLGVDFMSENVRAVLDAAGHADVEVYRVAAEEIGCSLAASAEAPAYEAWLRAAAATPSSLHVVYINTSLLTKARAHAIVPTITCTSSNVLQTLLQAAAQVPEVTIWYGPDTYMGGNLQTLLTQLATLSDAEIRKVHPAHDRESVADLLERFHYFGQGVCVVHHLFGDDVVRRVKEEHADALLTAHLEVPGEMFALAADAQRRGCGVVGSTSNILNFIAAQVDAAAERPGPQRVPVVLGTESGMITGIVHKVQEELRAHHRDDVAVEIVFPVASEAITATPGDSLLVVPGVPAAEGCSTAGGCATCPYMKMNHLDALMDVLEAVGTDREAGLKAYRPRKYVEKVGDRTAASVGSEPILHMRHFQRTGALPDALVQDIRTRAQTRATVPS